MTKPNAQSTVSLVVLAAQRIWNQRLLMLCLLVGVLAAVGLLSAIPLYSDAAQNSLLQAELTEQDANLEPFGFMWRYVGTWHGNVNWEAYEPVDEYLSEQAPSVIGLPVEQQVRHVATSKMRLFPGEDAAFVPDEPLLWASIGYLDGITDEIIAVEGDLPSSDESAEAVPVMISQATADKLGIQVGEDYVLMGTGTDTAQITIQIAGIWRAADPDDSCWFYAPDAYDEVLITTKEAFTDIVAQALNEPVATSVWYQIYDGDGVRSADVAGLLGQVSTVESRVTALLENTTLDASPVDALDSYRSQATLLTVQLTVFGLPIVGLVAYFIGLIASMVVARGRSEIAIMRGRGISRQKVVLLYAIEGLLVGAVGFVGGLVLGKGIAQAMSRAHTFLDSAMFSLQGDAPMPIVYTPTAIIYGLVGVALCMVMLLVPALVASRDSIVTLRREQARASLRPIWQRYYLDLIMLVPPAYGWYQLAKQGSLSLGSGSTNPFNNPLLFVVPILFCFALGLVAMRLFPVLMGSLAWIAARFQATTPLLTLRQLARSASQYTGPLLLLVLTVSLATFTASMAATLDDHLYDQVYYQVGADMNLAEMGESTEEDETTTLDEDEEDEEDEEEAVWLFLPVSEHLLVDGVSSAARVGDYVATASIGGSRQAGRILGIDRVDFPETAFYRSDLSDESLGGLMNRLGLASDAILVSSDFMAQQGLQVSDALRLSVGISGDYADVDFTIVGAIDLFPTLYPQDGPFFVANLDHIHDAFGGTYPYDVWLSTDPTADPTQIVDDVCDMGIVVVTDQDARTMILDEQSRPERQGLFGLLTAGFVADAVLTVVGFLVFSIVSFKRRFIELGLLRAVGLSVGQMAGYLAGELTTLIVIGVGLGSALGVWVSSVFIPFFQVGTDKTAIVPPYVVQIAWQQVGQIAIVFCGMLLLAIAVLGALLARMRVFEAVKLGEAM